MAVTAALVKELREKTGAGMMDCKKALTEADCDFDKAEDWLRKKGLSAAAKKSGRVAAEGLVSAKVESNVGVVVEVNSETDFVSRNEDFQNLVQTVCNQAITVSSIDELKESTLDSGSKVGDLVVNSIAKIGENLTLRRTDKASVESGLVSAYVHNETAKGMGKIAVLVALEAKCEAEKLVEAGKMLAMHIAASSPISLNTDGVDQSIIEKEKEIFKEQAKSSGKPDNIIEKMVDGRIRKFFEEVVLLEQTYIIDNKTKIKDVLAELSKEVGSEVTIKSYVRYELGEGIEKEETNFAAEVAAVSKGS